MTKGLGTPISAHFEQGIISGTITQMVIGGTAAVISGGKFANGARTAAYQALFNYLSKSVFSMVKAAKVAAEHKKLAQAIQALSVSSFGHRQVLAAIYCDSGLDNAKCTTFNDIVESADTASYAKMRILMHINHLGVQKVGVEVGNVATSYYKDALGIPIGRGTTALKDIYSTMSSSIETVEQYCKVNNLLQAGGCL